MITVGITAIGSGIGHAVYRSLWMGRMPVRIVGFDANPGVPNLHWCDAAYVVPRAGDPGYVDHMMDLCRDEGIAALIPGSEPELSVLAWATDRFAAAGITVVASSGQVVDLCTDKMLMGEFAATHNLPFASTWSLQAAKESADDLPYPVVVKPRLGAASVGVRVARTPAEIGALREGADLIVQAWAGDPKQAGTTGSVLAQNDEFGIQYSVAPSGEVLGRFPFRANLKMGIFWEGWPRFDRGLEEQTLSTVQAMIPLGVRGPLNLQGRLHQGQVTLYEANARFSGGNMMRTAAGFREVEAAIHAIVFGDEHAARECVSGPYTDIRMVRYLDEVVTPPQPQPPAMASAPRPKRTGQRVLLTGATGFNGPTLLDRLLESDWVDEVRVGDPGRRTIAHHPKLTVGAGRLPDEPYDLDGIDVVIHAAAQTTRPGMEFEEADLYRVNAVGTGRLAAAAKQAGVGRFIYISSQSVYGTDRPAPFNEAHAPAPTTAYGYSKWFGEELAREMGPETLLILRPCRIYGLTRNVYWNVMPHPFARAAVDGRIVINGPGDDRLNMIHIQDLCDAVVAGCTLSLPPLAVVNVGAARSVTLLELAGLTRSLAKEFGIEAEIAHGERRGDRLDLGMDIRRARSLLEWQPRVDLATGMSELVEAAFRVDRDGGAAVPRETRRNGPPGPQPTPPGSRTTS